MIIIFTVFLALNLAGIISSIRLIFILLKFQRQLLAQFQYIVPGAQVSAADAAVSSSPASSTINDGSKGFVSDYTKRVINSIQFPHIKRWGEEL